MYTFLARTKIHFNRRQVYTHRLTMPSILIYRSTIAFSRFRKLQALILSVLLLSLSENVDAGKITPLTHMTNACSKTLQVNESLLLDLTAEPPAGHVPAGNLACAIVVVAPPGKRLYVHVLQLAICDEIDKPDRLHFYDISTAGREVRITPPSGLYGVLERQYLIYNTAGLVVPDFRSSEPRMKIDYLGKPTDVYNGFRLLITTFFDADINGACQEGSMLCPYEHMCVSEQVRCDALPNCGQDDSQDERQCEKIDVVTNLLEEYAMRTAVTASVSGILVFVVCVLAVVIIIQKYHRYKSYTSLGQSVHYTSRCNGRCTYKDNESQMSGELPTYGDVMKPEPEHVDPPPAYKTITAAHVHHTDDFSDDEYVRLTSTSYCMKHGDLDLLRQKFSSDAHAMTLSRSCCMRQECSCMHHALSGRDENDSSHFRREEKSAVYKGNKRKYVEEPGSIDSPNDVLKTDCKCSGLCEQSLSRKRELNLENMPVSIEREEQPPNPCRCKCSTLCNSFSLERGILTDSHLKKPVSETNGTSLAEKKTESVSDVLAQSSPENVVPGIDEEEQASECMSNDSKGAVRLSNTDDDSETSVRVRYDTCNALNTTFHMTSPVQESVSAVQL